MSAPTFDQLLKAMKTDPTNATLRDSIYGLINNENIHVLFPELSDEQCKAFVELAARQQAPIIDLLVLTKAVKRSPFESATFVALVAFAKANNDKFDKVKALFNEAFTNKSMPKQDGETRKKLKLLKAELFLSCARTREEKEFGISELMDVFDATSPRDPAVALQLASALRGLDPKDDRIVATLEQVLRNEKNEVNVKILLEIAMTVKANSGSKHQTKQAKRFVDIADSWEPKDPDEAALLDQAVMILEPLCPS